MPDTFKNGQSVQTDNLSKLVGNTPLIALRYRFRGGEVQEILVKCEQYNLTGSIKDRVALYVLQKAKEEKLLKPGDLILQSAGTHMGISFAAIGRALGHRVKLLVSGDITPELLALIKSYGAETQFGDGQETCGDVFLPLQLGNKYNAEVHDKMTGREIGHSLLLERIKPAAFVAGVGSGATLAGIGKYLRSLFPDLAVHPLITTEPNSRVPGICGEFNGQASALGLLNELIRVSDGDAILMAQKLMSQVNLPVGISSGANLLGAIKMQQEAGSGKVVITIFPDGSKYHPVLLQNEAVKEGYLSPDIELMDYNLLKKV